MDRYGVVGISHHRASLEELGRFIRVTAPLAELPAALGVDEAVLLQTCNRVELYYYAAERPLPDEVLRAMARTLAPGDPEAAALAEEVGYAFGGTDAHRHLCRVVAGLDSRVFGEEQIAGQFRRALQAARDAGACGPWLGLLADEVSKHARRIRSQLRLGPRPASVPEVAAVAVRRALRREGGRVVLLGAGEVVSTLAPFLPSGERAELLFVNRTLERAEALAERHHGRAMALAEFLADPPEFRVLVAAVGAPEPVVRPEHLRRLAPPARPRLLVDLGLPADLDPAFEGVDGFRRLDLFAVSRLVERNRQELESLERRVQPLLRQALVAFREKLYRRHVGPVAARLHRAVLERAEREAERWLDTRLAHLSPEDAHLFRAFALRLAEQTVQVPLIALRKTLHELPFGELLVERLRREGRRASERQG